MVKANYSCDICKKRYNIRLDALTCEAQGILGKEIQPGLTLIRLNTNSKKLYENLFIILKRDLRYAKRVEFAHHKVYRVGSVSFSNGGGEYDWDRWDWGIKKSQEIEVMLKEQKLKASTKDELVELADYLQGWRNKIARALKEPNASVEPYKGCLEPEIINTIDQYKLRLHNRSPFK